jgi:hypothetical protein
MFERYTEQGRRAIFFARHEASNYGSEYIETEHLLLGVLREFHLTQPDVSFERVREEIERHITRGQPYPTNVEVSLSEGCKKALLLALEEADRLNARMIGPEHVVLGLLRIENSLAARILKANNVRANTFRAQIAKGAGYAEAEAPHAAGGTLALEDFLAGLRLDNSGKSAAIFAKNGLFVDASGKAWSREEIIKEFAALFAPYAKKNANLTIEQTLADTSNVLVVTVLMKNVVHAGEQRVWVHRMSVVVVPESQDWAILLAQVTPVQ